MILSKLQLIVGVLILFVFFSVSILGLSLMHHSVGQPMVDCPYTNGSFAVCSDNLNHIIGWKGIFNIIVSFIVYVLFVSFILYFVLSSTNNLFLNWKRIFLNRLKFTPLFSNILTWLSFLENSPSFKFST